LSIGAVTPSGKALARTMAGYLDPDVPGPIVELGPGTGPVTERSSSKASIQSYSSRQFARLLPAVAARYPATVVQGGAYSLKRLLAVCTRQRGVGIRSSVVPKPLRMRLRLLFEAFGLMPGALRRLARSLRAGLVEHSAGAGVDVPADDGRGQTTSC
jgi:phosphatidylethanolamine/phosphatidyl-N-methylethanolamine N-methyltransferase